MNRYIEAVPYKKDSYEVTADEYLEYESLLEKCDSQDIDAIEWTTFDFLISKGYFVTKPECERPSEPFLSTRAPPIRATTRRKKQPLGQNRENRENPFRYNFYHNNGKCWGLGDWVKFGIMGALLLSMFAFPALSIILIIGGVFLLAKTVPSMAERKRLK